MKIIITGNPVDGMTFHGPLQSEADIDGYGAHAQADWWVAEVTPLESDEPAPLKGVVEVGCNMRVYLHVDLELGTVIETVVQTPNVASMGDLLHEPVAVDFTYHEPESGMRFGREANDAERAEAIKILDANCWPDPELVS